jgi:hypothetical protein
MMAPSGDKGKIPYSAASFNFYLMELKETETEIKTKTKMVITTDNKSSTSSKNFSQIQQSTDSLSDLSQDLSGLTLAPAKPRRGQFGYQPEDGSSPYTLSPATFSTSTLLPSPSTLSPSPMASQSFWDHLPHYNTPETSPLPILITAYSSNDEEMPQPTFFYGDG